MTVTTDRLTRAAGVAAAAAGAIFIGVQINHPHAGRRPPSPPPRCLIRESVEGRDGRAGAGRHHRHVPEPGPPQRRPRARRLPRARRRLPRDHVRHPFTRRVRPADRRQDQPRLRQGRHRRWPPARGTAPATSEPWAWCAQVQASATWPAGCSSASPCSAPASSPAGPPCCSPPVASSALALVADAGRLLPAARLPERHRHDRPRLLAVAQPAHAAAARPGAPHRRRSATEPAAVR